MWYGYIVLYLKNLPITNIYRGMASSDRSSSSRSSSSSSSSSSSKESVDLLQELTNEMRIAVAEVEQEVFMKMYFLALDNNHFDYFFL